MEKRILEKLRGLEALSDDAKGLIIIIDDAAMKIERAIRGKR